MKSTGMFQVLFQHCLRIAMTAIYSFPFKDTVVVVLHDVSAASLAENVNHR